MVVNNRFLPNNVSKPGNNLTRTLERRPDAVDTGFGTILRNKINAESELKFSKHAEQRLRERNINLTAGQKEKLGSAVVRAGDKGVRDTLVVVDDLAFVVNVRNKTVITAVNSRELKENVFTNIDGAVFT